jgi:hypothetical protein
MSARRSSDGTPTAGRHRRRLCARLYRQQRPDRFPFPPLPAPKGTNCPANVAALLRREAGLPGLFTSPPNADAGLLLMVDGVLDKPDDHRHDRPKTQDR